MLDCSIPYTCTNIGIRVLQIGIMKQLVRIYTDKSCQDGHHADADQNDLYLTHQSDKMRSVKKIKYEIEVQKKTLLWSDHVSQGESGRYRVFIKYCVFF